MHTFTEPDHRAPNLSILALEEKGAEISSSPDELEVPQWHQDLLDQREQSLKSGTEQILDWEDAKAQIQLAVR